MIKSPPVKKISRPRRWTFLLFSLLLFVPSLVVAQQVSFSDVSHTHPDYVAISFLRDNGIIRGYADNTFKPFAHINKAEITKIIVESLTTDSDIDFDPIFPDVTEDLWYAQYVLKAHELGFVNGNDVDGSFEGAKPVNLAEFLKMLLMANNINVTSFEGSEPVSNISSDAWYANFINYAATIGIIQTTSQGTIDPAKPLTRAEVSDIIYLLTVTQKGDDTQFLLNRARAEMAQIEVYVAANQLNYAKNAASLGVDLTQQAYKNMPTDPTVLGAAKLARAYDWLVDAYILGSDGKDEAAAVMANDVIKKATEAWVANNENQPIAAHIKERARKILDEVGGVEIE